MAAEFQTQAMPRCGRSKWLVLGHYGGNNTGDDAMLAGLLDAAQESKLGPLVVASRAPARQLIERSGSLCIPAQVWPVLRELIKCRGLVIGGGTHFHDDYRGLRYLRHVRYMLRFVVLSVCARLLRKPVYWLGVGLGPIDRDFTQSLLRIGLSVCTGLATRDHNSYELGVSMRKKRPTIAAFDLAALLCTRPTKLERQSHNPTLGVSITSHSLRVKSLSDDLIVNPISAAISRAYELLPSLSVRIHVFRGGTREDDNDVSRLLEERLLRRGLANVKLIEYISDPVELLGTIAPYSAFLCTRFHSQVLAYLAGLPLLALAYHAKVAALAEEIELPPRCLLAPERLDSHHIAELLVAMLTRPQEFTATLPAREAIRRSFRNIEMLLSDSSET